MENFDKRKKAHEAKFARDHELAFKATARRNKLLGLWAAELMGKTGDDADAYAKEVIRADFEAPGEEDVFRKVFGDLEAAGVGVSEHRVRRRMAELMDTAREQLLEE